jgi:hypothetical protein
MAMTEYDKQVTIEDFTERCAKASLTPEQTAQVLGFRFDGFWCNTDATANTIIDFFQWANDKELGDWLEKYKAEDRVCKLGGNGCDNVLCPECGDPRDTSVMAVTA